MRKKRFGSYRSLSESSQNLIGSQLMIVLCTAVVVMIFLVVREL